MSFSVALAKPDRQQCALQHGQPTVVSVAIRKATTWRPALATRGPSGPRATGTGAFSNPDSRHR